IEQPGRWNKEFIRKFTFVFGPISSLFDFLTFFILLYIFHSSPSVFRTGWFLESLATQTFVIFIIRTRKIPFFKSRPSIALVISSILVLIIGIGITISPFASYFEFIKLPFLFFPF